MTENNINGMELNLEDLEQVSGGKNEAIKATGDVNVRKGPGLGYDTIGVVKKGETVPFLGEVQKDSRGVYWGKVSYKGKTGWVSSKYAKLI
ncbi:MAG: SH3 domain-containing protein [Clostridia bacterium]|nr:SH3 domain-containing protein [Clostridia bacterium]